MISVTSAFARGTIEAGYVGSKSNRLSGPEPSLNQVPLELLSLSTKLIAPIPNPFFASMPASSALRSPTLPRVQLLRPFPRFSTVALYRNNVLQSSYHSLQVRAERRMRETVGLIASYYTFSAFLDDASSTFEESSSAGPRANFPVADSRNLHLERDRSSGDMPHVVSLGTVSRVDKRVRFARKRIVNALLSNWHFSVLFRGQSGTPMAVTQQPNFNAFDGFGVQRPNRIADPNLPPDQRSVDRLFRTEAFTLAPQFTIGGSSRNPVRGPGLDLMMGRIVPIAECVKLDFRVEALNTLNSPQFRTPNSIRWSCIGSITGAFDRRVFEATVKIVF